MLSFGRQNRIPGTCEQIQYILRDESIHMNFGIELINAIIDENPHVWEAGFKQEMIEFIKSAVVLEVEYIKDCLPNGVLGLNSDLLKEYIQYLADRRFEKLKLPIIRKTPKGQKSLPNKQTKPWVNFTILR